ncbi:hypothetical protein BJ322DRAFT_1143368 [Thelephora terrestris]|uniref:F-box domain-containing protein n=1 Tax=Thelephora terrestris TaxID=56493 RepID=A0A9P6HAL6_9AGAM|nr:hypothetical protein BJ322DRAFT_1143368 [Thelephora terrestris]
MSNTEKTILSDVNIFRRHPSPQDVTELRGVIESNEDSLASLKEEIEACSRQLSALRTKSYAHVLAIRRCKAAMTPARLLPSEILAKIFRHASEMGWTRSPIVASHVCSTWRAAAHFHPSVWSRITVNLDTRDPICWTKHWLTMARQASLHVAIVHTVPTAILGQVMALLLEHSEQWASLTLDLHFADTRQVLAMCNNRFTRLGSIRVSLFVSEGLDALAEQEGATGFVHAFQDAPRLDSITILGNIMPRDLPPRLTSLRIEYDDPSGHSIESPSSIIEALRNLPDLETLTLQLGVMYPVSLSPAGIPFIELPKLKSITYEDLRTGGFQVLRHLAAPSLVQLYAYIRPDTEDYEPPIYLVALLENSPLVETLELEGVDIWRTEWLSIFPRLPKLQKLHLHDSEIDDTVIERMFGESGLCPDLRRIDLRWCQHVSGTTLVQLVESRMKNGGCGIEEVAAIGCSLFTKQDALQLASLTTFRVVTEERDDRCRERKCCDNKQYRQRLKFHLLTLPKEERAGIRLAVD